MMPRLFRSSTFLGVLAASVLLAACRPADDAAKQGGAETGDARSAAEAPVPKIVSKDGRHALMVDGAPFLILGFLCLALETLLGFTRLGRLP